MARGKKQTYTVMGVTFCVDEEGLEAAGDDFRMWDDLTSRDQVLQFRGVTTLLRSVLGEEYERVLNELQGDEEKLTVGRVRDFYQQMCTAIGALKN